MVKPALGRGLGALLGGNPIAKPPTPALTSPPVPEPARALDKGERVQRVPIERIHPCALQPRKEFSPETLRELADSIKEQGIVQPLVVRERAGAFELIAGERRWRAAQLLGLRDVPVIVREADDRAALELALIENLQRENLNAIEEAQGYSRLIEEFSLTQEEVALKVGKSRTAVANSLRLLRLPAAVQGAIRSGSLSVGHAKVIAGLPSEKLQGLAASRVLKESLNVRQTERLVETLQAESEKSPAVSAPRTPDAHVASVEGHLRERLGTKVRLRYASGKGAVEISFFSDAELERILQLLGISLD